MKPVMVVAGTRPEIIKMAPIIRALAAHRVPSVFVHCGQHYHYNMSQQFIEDLGLPQPDYQHKLRPCTNGLQTARIMIYMEDLLKKVHPAIVLVEGDTNGVLATALAAIKLGIPVGHVEAGLRSFDLRMPEEHNRRLTDHVSSYLFAPTDIAENNLKEERAWGKTWVTGNTAIDAVIQHLPVAEWKSKILETVRHRKFVLATAHRAENVDDLGVLKSFIEAFSEAPLPVVYPIHPRTRKRLLRSNPRHLKTQNIQFLPPLGYLDFLVLMKKCQFIVTDSGGIQEEATSPNMRKPVLIIRLSTERPEAVKAGFAEVVGVEKNGIIDSMNRALRHSRELPESSPYGSGNAAEKIIGIIEKELKS